MWTDDMTIIVYSVIRTAIAAFLIYELYKAKRWLILIGASLMLFAFVSTVNRADIVNYSRPAAVTISFGLMTIGIIKEIDRG